MKILFMLISALMLKSLYFSNRQAYMARYQRIGFKLLFSK